MELTNRMSLWSCILKPTFWFFKELGYFSKHCKRVQIVYGSKHYKCYQYFNIYRMYRLVRLGQSDYALLGTCCPIVFQENQDKIVFLPLGTNSFSTHWKLGGETRIPCLLPHAQILPPRSPFAFQLAPIHNRSRHWIRTAPERSIASFSIKPDMKLKAVQVSLQNFTDKYAEVEVGEADVSDI